MNELMRDPIWQFIGALVALAGIAVSVIVYLAQKNRKSLAYDIVTATQLIGISESLNDRVQVLFDGQPTKDVWLVLVRIFNDGNTPIKTIDYERSVDIDFGDTANLLQVEVDETKPADIDLSITHNEHAVSIGPTLLNTMDSVTIKAFVSDFVQSPRVSVRIVGVKQIRRVGYSAVFPSSMPMFWIGFALSVAGAIVGMWMTSPAIFLGGGIAGFAMLTTPIFYDYRYRRFWRRWMLE